MQKPYLYAYMPPLYNRRPEPGLSASQPPVALPLAELLLRVKQSLSERFADSYWVVAEIADLTLPRFDGAHCYLTLTDQHQTGRGTQLKAQARATIWSQRYQQLAPVFEEHTGQPLRAGLKIMLRVQVKFHEQYGLSLDVVALDPTYTVGELARQLYNQFVEHENGKGKDFSAMLQRFETRGKTHA